uniref:Kinesin motor domain-containing protein n=1 Tax=Parastrongyloides trichosuri TaxID=131310 RepID=A0A0N4ZT07_PARTI
MSNFVFKTPKSVRIISKKEPRIMRSTSEKNIFTEGNDLKEPKRSLNECDFKEFCDKSNKRKSEISSNIKVSLRIKPHSESLEHLGMSIVEDNTLTISHGNRGLEFRFTNIFTKDSTQEDVYNKTAKELVDESIAGYNTCVFAYGQTGSGKTYSISGTINEPGILQRFSGDLFSRLKYTDFFVSYYEVYNEKVFDLLNYTKEPLRIRGAELAFVENLTKVQVRSLNELTILREKASINRATASTSMNERSSRSHAVFMLQISQKYDDENSINSEQSILRTSTAYFVDLAGSERATDADSEHIEETKSINKSLSFLQKLIFDTADKKSFINFRESVLTRLLKECFGGNSKTILLATISSEIKDRNISIGTLRFASKAALVRQQPKVYEDSNSIHIKMLKGKIQELEKIVGKNNSINKDNYHIANFKRPSAPALIELNSDSSLTMWQNLEPRVFKFGDEDICSISKSNIDLWQLHVYKDDSVYKNGEVMKKDKIIELNHCDRIVVCQQNFFIVYLDESTLFDTLPKLDDVRVEVATNEVVSQYEEILEKEKQSFIENERIIRSNIEREMDELRQQYEEKLIDVQTKEEKLRQQALDECRMLKKEIHLKEQFETELLKKFEEIQFELLDQINSGEDPEIQEAKCLYNKARIDVDIVNRMLESSNKNTIFTTSVFITDYKKLEFVIRLQNRKEKIYADLSHGEFEWLKCELSDAYTKTGTEEMFSKKFEDIFYSRNYPWKNTTDSIKSGLVSVAVRNSISMTAKKRRSTIAITKNALTARRQSTITALLESIKCSEDEDEEQILNNPFYGFRLSLYSNLREISSLCVEPPYGYIMSLFLKLSENTKDLKRFMKNDFNKLIGLNMLHDITSTINCLYTSSLIFSTIENDFCKDAFINYSTAVLDLKDYIAQYIDSLDSHVLNIQHNLSKIDEKVTLLQRIYGTCLSSLKVNKDDLYKCAQTSSSFFEGYMEGVDQFNESVESHLNNVTVKDSKWCLVEKIHKVSKFVTEKLANNEESEDLSTLFVSINSLFEVERILCSGFNPITFEITCKLTDLKYQLEEIDSHEDKNFILTLCSKLMEIITECEIARKNINKKK